MKTLNLKRLVSIATVICMIMVTAFFVPMTIASAETTNLVTKTSFNVTDWGSDSTNLSSALEANTTYKWSFKFATSGCTGTAKLVIAGFEVYSGAATQGAIQKGKFTTGEIAPTDETVTFSCPSGGGAYTISDLKIERIPSYDEITNYATQTSFSIGDWGNTSAALVRQLEANTTYKWSFKFATSGCTGTAKLVIAGFEVYSGAATQGAIQKGKFTTGEIAPTDETVTFSCPSGGGPYTVSDLIIEKVTILDPDKIENYVTKTSFIVTDWWQDSTDLIQELSSNTTYAWKFKLTEAGGTQNISFSIAGNKVFEGTGNQNDIKNGILEIGENAPESTEVLFKSRGGGQYQVADLVITKLFVGDVNCDTVVADNHDMITLRKIILGIETALYEDSADLNTDGKINILDLIRIKRYLAGEEVALG